MENTGIVIRIDHNVALPNNEQWQNRQEIYILVKVTK